MKPVTNRFRENHSIRTCPVSGLTVLQKPEWQDVNLGEGYKISISQLGDNIFFLQPSGYATLKVIKQFEMLMSNVLANSDNRVRPYIQIEDYSRLTGVSLEARKYYIDYLKSQEKLLGLVFVNVSPILKLSIKLARRLKQVNFSVKIADGYDSAVRIAQTLFTDRQIKAGDGYEVVDSKPFKIFSQKSSGQKIIQHPGWHLQIENFSLRFEVINDNVLHGISTGRLEKSHIEPSLQLQEEVTRSAGLSAGPYYYVLGLKDSAGTNQRARKQYVNAILRLYKKNPFRMFVFYGANRFIKAGINLAKPLIPFKVGIVDNIDLALALIADDEAKNLSTGNFSGANASIPKPYTQTTLQQYVDELLQFLEEINWESDSTNKKKERDPSHPFSTVFDGIELIKWEFDDLIRERTQSEKEIRRAKTLAEKANSAKSEFLANMSHELRTPLNHIIGFTELVMDKNFGELNETQEEYLGDVVQSSKHLLALINDILDLSKVEAGKQELELSTFNPVYLLKSSVVMVKEKALKHSIQLSLDINGIPEAIQADERMFKQIMYNLLSNAAKFTPDGGKISVTAQICDLNAGDNRDNGVNQACGLKVSVSDTGIGIHPNDLNRIFNPFDQVETSSSRKYQGTGLGLSLCKNFVNLHGGEIWAESRGAGHGSSFHFVIPVKQDDT